MKPGDQPSNALLQGHLRELRFDTAHGVGDQQAVLVGRYPDDARYGPVLTIQPEVGNYRGTRELAAGRIIARILNPTESGYEKLGVEPQSVTYWWVRYDSAQDVRQSRFISTSAATGEILAVTERSLYVEQRHPREYRQALARWWWNARDESAWAPCGWYCCRSPS